MIEVVCWKWRPPRGYRSTFGPQTVNVLRAMVERHLHVPHRFTCITDEPEGIDPRVRIIPIWDTHARVPNPSSPVNPSCYRRLRLFSSEARELIGERVLSLDLDMVITRDITPLVNRPEDFVIWGGQSQLPGGRGKPYAWYNGSLMMLRTGTRTRVWDEFNPAVSPRQAHQAGCRGSDQGWIAYCLGPKEAIWGTSDGVYSYRNHILPSGTLPGNARIVSFHGKHDPWDPQVQRASPWIREHYRE